jgi:hypothetical protein
VEIGKVCCGMGRICCGGVYGLLWGWVRIVVRWGGVVEGLGKDCWGWVGVVGKIGKVCCVVSRG